MVHLLGLGLHSVRSTFAPQMREDLESSTSHCCIEYGTNIWCFRSSVFGTVDRGALIVTVKVQMVDSGCF